jgi:hypothetical protein
MRSRPAADVELDRDAAGRRRDDGATPKRDGALVTGAAQMSLSSGWSFLARFDGEFSSTTSIYGGSGMVKKIW